MVCSVMLKSSLSCDLLLKGVYFQYQRGICHRLFLSRIVANLNFKRRIMIPEHYEEVVLKAGDMLAGVPEDA